MRSYGRSEGLGWGIWLLILVLVVVIASGVALTFYGSKIHPVQQEVEQVLSNDRFPR